MKGKRIGITGPIGSGKSFVATRLSTLGYPVYSADLAGRRLANTSADLRRGIVALLGDRAYGADGLYDRAWVASLVFGDASLLSALNGLIHPAVFADYADWCVGHGGHRWLFFESALLPRLDWRGHLDGVVSVVAPLEVRVARVMARDGVTGDQVLARMRWQGEESEYEAMADLVVRNVGTAADLAREVEGLLLAMEVHYA